MVRGAESNRRPRPEEDVVLDGQPTSRHHREGLSWRHSFHREYGQLPVLFPATGVTYAS